MSKDNFLYHYTNISSLALILKNRNIKFNPLTVLDDFEEELIKDKQSYGKYCFVSSWTDDNKESIPMWNMYTNITEGVRIGLPKYPFQNYYLDRTTLDKISEEFNVNIDDEYANFLIPIEKLLEDDYFLGTSSQKNILTKVEYTDEEDKLTPQILEVNDEKTTLNMSSLGSYKNTYWSFQNEWRYKLTFLPVGYKDMSEGIALGDKNQKVLKKIHDCADLPINYYLLNLDESKFEEMEIILSPKISEGNEILVNLLVDKYNPNASVKKSCLTNKLR